MSRVTSVHVGDVPAQQMGTILSKYWAIEELRQVRREFLPQLAVVAGAMAGLRVMHVMSTLESVSAIAVLAAVALFVVALEWFRQRGLVRAIGRLQPGTGVLRYSAPDVRKS